MILQEIHILRMILQQIHILRMILQEIHSHCLQRITQAESKKDQEQRSYEKYSSFTGQWW
jgi:hypothetical protein